MVLLAGFSLSLQPSSPCSSVGRTLGFLTESHGFKMGPVHDSKMQYLSQFLVEKMSPACKELILVDISRTLLG